MISVPRPPKRGADDAAVRPVDGTAEPPPSPADSPDPSAHASPDGSLPPNGVDGSLAAEPQPSPTEPHHPPAATNGSAPSDNPGDGLSTVQALAIPASSGPRLAPDPGLYAVLGLDPSVPDAVIQTTYRRQAARLINGSSSSDNQALRRLNVAYEVLGNPVRRAEYDRLRVAQLMSAPPRTPIRPGAKISAGPRRRTRPRHVVQTRYPGLPEVLVLLLVVGVAVVVGVNIIPRLPINLSALNGLQNVLPLSNTSRRVIDTTVTPAPATPAPTPTVRPGVAERFAGTTVSVSSPTPAQNTVENVVIRLRRDGQPAQNFEVWATVQYRTTEERWPATGALKTDGSGTATISFNIGPATPNFPVTVRVFAQVDDQQLSWSTTFTPR
jgi:hypothetical protein